MIFLYCIIYMIYLYTYIRSLYIHIFQPSQLSPRSEAELEAAEAQLEAALEAQQQATARYEEAMAVGARFSGGRVGGRMGMTISWEDHWNIDNIYIYM